MNRKAESAQFIASGSWTTTDYFAIPTNNGIHLGTKKSTTPSNTICFDYPKTVKRVERHLAKLVSNRNIFGCQASFSPAMFAAGTSQILYPAGCPI